MTKAERVVIISRESREEEEKNGFLALCPLGLFRVIFSRALSALTRFILTNGFIRADAQSIIQPFSSCFCAGPRLVIKVINRRRASARGNFKIYTFARGERLSRV